MNSTLTASQTVGWIDLYDSKIVDEKPAEILGWASSTEYSPNSILPMKRMDVLVKSSEFCGIRMRIPVFCTINIYSNDKLGLVCSILNESHGVKDGRTEKNLVEMLHYL